MNTVTSFRFFASLSLLKIEIRYISPRTRSKKSTPVCIGSLEHPLHVCQREKKSINYSSDNVDFRFCSLSLLKIKIRYKPPTTRSKKSTPVCIELLEHPLHVCRRKKKSINYSSDNVDCAFLFFITTSNQSPSHKQSIHFLSPTQQVTSQSR